MSQIESQFTGKETRDITIIDAIETGVQHDCPVIFADAERETTSWARLYDDAKRLAGVLQAKGVGYGAHVAVLSRTSMAVVASIEAVWLTGATLVILPLPNRTAAQGRLVAELQRRAFLADIDYVIVDAELAELARAFVDSVHVIDLNELHREARQAPHHWSKPKIKPEMPAVLQFTSGSTSEPKGVIITHNNVVANLEAMADATLFDPESDVLVSWLPLYHDMGLFGFLVFPMCQGAKLVLTDPQSFLSNPSSWMSWMSHYQASHTAAPSFAYAMAARALCSASQLDLTSCKCLLSGSEQVNVRLLRSFAAAGARHGLDAAAICCGFGLAEATLAVSLPRPLSGLRVDMVEAESLDNEGFASPTMASASCSTKELALLGRAIPGIEIRIVDESGKALPERFVGEITVRGPSVTPGYYKNEAGSAEILRGEWLHTGDLGYIAQEELVVCGRSKDVIVLGGRNIYPHDIECIVEDIPGVRPGNVVAVGILEEGRRVRTIVVAEHRSDAPNELRKAIRNTVRDRIGIRLDQVRLQEPGSIPKTSSGKVMRSQVVAGLVV